MEADRHKHLRPTMKIHLRVNTGQGITIEGTINSSELPQNLAQKMEQLLQPDVLAAAANTPVNQDMVDMQQYELTLIPDAQDRGDQHFQFTDAGCPVALLELLDDLVHEIIIKKRHDMK